VQFSIQLGVLGSVLSWWRCASVCPSDKALLQQALQRKALFSVRKTRIQSKLLN